MLRRCSTADRLPMLFLDKEATYYPVSLDADFVKALKIKSYW